MPRAQFIEDQNTVSGRQQRQPIYRSTGSVRPQRKVLMNLDLALVLLVLAAAIVMFVIDRPRMDAVALLVMVTLPFTGIITMNEALAGFSDSSIILIAALFVIGESLVRTGVARRLGDWLDTKAGRKEKQLL